jgi:rare lipoprotein A
MARDGAGRWALMALLSSQLAACAAVGPGTEKDVAPVRASVPALPEHAIDGSAILGPAEMPALGAGVEPTTGRISWYGQRFAGRATANGERFDPSALTMAHRELPFGTQVRVTNPANGASVVLRVNDRGPFVGGRVADVSYGAARRLGMLEQGVITAQLEPLAD